MPCFRKQSAVLRVLPFVHTERRGLCVPKLRRFGQRAAPERQSCGPRPGLLRNGGRREKRKPRQAMKRKRCKRGILEKEEIVEVRKQADKLEIGR